MTQQYEKNEHEKLQSMIDNVAPTLGINLSYNFTQAVEESAQDLYQQSQILYVHIFDKEASIVSLNRTKQTFSQYKKAKHFILRQSLLDPVTHQEVAIIEVVYSREHFTKTITYFYNLLILVGGLFIFLLFFFIYFIQRSIAPFKHLITAMQNFNPNTPKPFDLVGDQKSEVGLILHASNQMIESINSYIQTQNQLQETLQKREQHLSNAQRMAHVGSWEYTLGTDKFEASDEMLRILGIKKQHFFPLWNNFLNYIHEEDKEYVVSAINEIVKTGGQLNIKYRCIKGNGDYIDIHTQAKVRKKLHKEDRLIGVSMDVSEQNRSQQLIEKLAYYDPLTGLANRSLFKNRLDKTIITSKRHKNQFAVLFIDLDHFKNINDSLGHMVGDALLKEVASIFLELLRDEDTVSRLGGDEFTILIPSYNSMQGLEELARKILTRINGRHSIGKHELYISLSMGISCYPQHGENSDTLIKNADTAMYQAKELGRNNFKFYQTQMGNHLTHELELEQDFRRAVEALQEFKLYYQPKMDFKTLKISGAEALIRWEHPTKGLLFPDSFIPLAESSGLIIKLGDWIIEEGIRQLQIWQQGCKTPLQLSINLSAQQFQDESLIPTIERLIHHYAVEPHLLEFEITESISMNNVSDNIITMNALKSLGVKIAIDDFGTGYSSLAYLKQFPIDTLKIDQSFIRDMLEDDDDKVIASTIISMSSALGLKTVAEGVETLQHQHLLQEMQCDTAQGYYYAKAINAKEFIEFAYLHRVLS